MSKNIKLAFDRSLRSIDHDGRMHVEISNISKAIVNPYRGSEIPNSEGLGLDPDQVYYLLRDPAELAKAAATFNNIPILDRHVPVHVTEPQKEYVVGSTGTDAEFDGTYLRNSLVIWDAGAIAGIDTKEQCELSSAYRYDADMTSGKFADVHYDGIMRNIRGNHVALVECGRAGPDVIVGDSKLLENPKMSGKKLSANARAMKGALIGFLTSRIAMDAKIGDLTAIVGSVKTLKNAKDQQAIVGKVTAATKGKLAEDATLDGLPELLVQLAQDEEDDNKLPTKGAQDADEEDDDEETKAAKIKAAQDEEDAKAAAAKEDDGKVDKKAMDAAIKQVETATITRMRAIHVAEKEVEPFVGAVDSSSINNAADIYKLALDAKGVDTTDVHPSAFRAMVGMLGGAKADTSKTKVVDRIAQDSAAETDFFTRYPKAAKGGAK